MNCLAGPGSHPSFLALVYKVIMVVVGSELLVAEIGVPRLLV